MVVGRKKDGTWIVVEGSCQRGNMGKRGEGDGTYNGSGSAVVQTSKSIGSAIWEHSDNTWTKYGYIADEIDYCELAKYLKTGQ